MIFSKTGTSAGIGFAVPAHVIGRVVPQIIKSGHAEEIGFGVEVDPNQRAEKRLGLKGVLVLDVVKESPAEAADVRGLERTPDGVAIGDVVVGIGSSKVTSYDDFYNALDEHHAGEEIDVKLLRKGGFVSVHVPLIVEH